MCIPFMTDSNEVATPIEADSRPSAMNPTEQEWELIQRKVEDGQAITFSELVALSIIPPFDMRTMLAPKARIPFARTMMRNLEDLEAAGYISISTPLKLGEDGIVDARRPSPPPLKYQPGMLFPYRVRIPTPEWAIEDEVRKLQREISDILERQGPVSHSAWVALKGQLASREINGKSRTCSELDAGVVRALKRENDDWNTILKIKSYTTESPSALPLDDEILRDTITALMRLCGVPDEVATLSTSPEDVDSALRRYLEPHMLKNVYFIDIRLFPYFLHQRRDADFNRLRYLQQSHVRVLHALGSCQARPSFSQLYRTDYRYVQMRR
ncbi:hypothetical protein MKX07_005060 [Trichoderma sp. CBMAI-0711]|nr:hypothetical protein MKX07_005060 [Trichoderma sp. CBMAI-0711]